MNNIKLKCCPFCGNTGVMITTDDKYYWVRCSSCDSEHGQGGSEAEAAKAWNSRGEQSQQQEIADQKRQLEDKAKLIKGVDKANSEMALEIAELKAMVETLRVAAILTDKEFRHHAKVESFETTVLSEALAKTEKQS